MKSKQEIQDMINKLNGISNDKENNSLFREDSRIKSQVLNWVLGKMERII